jgi:hypothetical protein
MQRDAPTGVPTWSGALVKFDADGDGAMDYARLAQSPSHVVIAFVRGPLSRASRIQWLDFPVNAGSQDGICALPASLAVEKTDYAPGSESTPDLPGFKPSHDLRGLALKGGECDDVHLYWNHDAHRLDWWRR